MTTWEFDLGQLVYLRTDTEQLARIVTERKEEIGGTKSYGLSHELVFSFHYAVEITEEYSDLVKLGINKEH
jgi:hypothetical protein